MTAAGDRARPPGRLWLMPLAGWLLTAAAGYYPTRSLGGRNGLEAMFAAQALVVAIVYVTLLPAMRKMVGASPAEKLRVALKAGTIRLLVTLPVIAAVAWRGVFEPAAFLIWVAITYVVLIQVETLTLVYWNRRLENHE